jgi:hypothetical protein
VWLEGEANLPERFPTSPGPTPPDRASSSRFLAPPGLEQPDHHRRPSCWPGPAPTSTDPMLPAQPWPRAILADPALAAPAQCPFLPIVSPAPAAPTLRPPTPHWPPGSRFDAPPLARARHRPPALASHIRHHEGDFFLCFCKHYFKIE